MYANLKLRGSQLLRVSTLIVNKAVGNTRIDPPNTPPTPLLLLKHGMFSPTDHCAELSPHPCDPPIGSFHSATMAARGRVI